MLTEVMRHYGLARPPVDVGFFETEPPSPRSRRDLRADDHGRQADRAHRHHRFGQDRRSPSAR